jgi:hypothetical protein
MPARACEPGCRKKKRIVNFLKVFSGIFVTFLACPKKGDPKTNIWFISFRFSLRPEPALDLIGGGFA